MAPHRLQPVATALSPLRSAFASPAEPGPGVVAGLLALAAAFYNLHVAVLLILVVSGGILDLWTGARRARIRDRLGLPGGFDRAVLDEGIGGKSVTLVVLLFIGASIDALVSIAGGAADLGFAGLFSEYTPATSALLAYRWAREVSSIRENHEATPGGKNTIWPGAIRFVDALRYRMIHPTSGALPQDRWDDGLTIEEKAWIHQQLGERRARFRPDPQEGE